MGPRGLRVYSITRPLADSPLVLSLNLNKIISVVVVDVRNY